MSSVSNQSKRIVFCCSRPEAYRDLIFKLLQNHVVTVATQLYDCKSISSETLNDIYLFEIPSDEEIFLMTLQEIFELNPEINIIILNGGAKRNTIAEAFRIGVCDYFPEPVNTILLVERINVLL